MHRAIIRNGGPDRVSHFIKRQPAVNIHHASRYSERLGLPLNRLVTINFSHTSCPASKASGSFRKLLTQRFAPWLRRTAQGEGALAPTYVWVLEGAGGQTCVHWLLHIPAGMWHAFSSKLEEWLRGLFTLDDGPEVLNTKPIYNLIGVRRYVLKGTDPIWAEHLAVRPVPQGLIVGKRSGFSRNLGPAARVRGGYKPKAFLKRRDG